MNESYNILHLVLAGFLGRELKENTREKSFEFRVVRIQLSNLKFLLYPIKGANSLVEILCPRCEQKCSQLHKWKPKVSMTEHLCFLVAIIMIHTL